jgi:O2-independent ubiquinone biosynthesis accessory factor UbiT
MPVIMPNAETALDQLARHMPPPQHLGRAMQLCPAGLRMRVLADSLNRYLAEQVLDDEWALLEGKVLAIELTDLRLSWWLSCRSARLEAAGPEAAIDAKISGCTGDFILLAGRLEDPDTLFFERRLEVTGDTASGLLLRNLLDRMPAQALPLPVRIVLNRAARFSQRLRRHRVKSSPV